MKGCTGKRRPLSRATMKKALSPRGGRWAQSVGLGRRSITDGGILKRDLSSARCFSESSLPHRLRIIIGGIRHDKRGAERLISEIWEQQHRMRALSEWKRKRKSEGFVGNQCGGNKRGRYEGSPNHLI
ncbi:hypothetical protein LIER_31691 [Lithospermum erythrorhizon]|uniref:Uncharacterized protein n=1 Tax=Lithospermum erythrorhizon TaxID=34254 RepID=A0AAV3RTL3_LITER